MTSTYPVRCRCGQLQGELAHPERGSRGVCYCRDCQAFAHFLGSPRDVLDPLGGTDVVAVAPRWLTFTAGTEHLACMSLTEHGALRWFARCCGTPIGNTPPDRRFSHLGLIHSCLQASGRSLDESFGPVRMRLNTHSAKGPAPPAPVVGFIMALLPYIGSLAWSRISGQYRQNPFFDASGQPRVKPRVLSQAEHEKLMGSL